MQTSRSDPVITGLQRAVRHPERALHHLRSGFKIAAARLSPGLTRSWARGPLPDFLGIGAQKAGTTWLYANLKRHPEIYLPERKEIHYFDRDLHRSLTYYTSYFTNSDGYKARGEVTPAYSALSSTRIRFIRSVMPDVRLILLLRDPIERLWSAAMMNLVRFPGRPYESVSEREFLDYMTRSGALARGDYVSILRKWSSVFGPEQLHVEFFERVSGDPQGLLRDIFQFLGVSTDIEWGALPYERAVNVGSKHPIPLNIREALQELYAPEFARLREQLTMLNVQPNVSWL